MPSNGWIVKSLLDDRGLANNSPYIPLSRTVSGERIIRSVEATEAERMRFGQALTRLRGDRSQPWLADVMGVSDESVRMWEKGASEPTRARVFELERILGAEPGALSRLLGYLPLDAIGPFSSVEDALDADDELTPEGRNAMRIVLNGVRASAPR